MDHEGRHADSQPHPRPADDRGGSDDAAVPLRPGGPTTSPATADLENHARDLERRAVEVDEAVARARARAGRSGSGANGSVGRVSPAELRRLQAEADRLLDRALTARLEADRAAGASGSTAAGGGSPPLPVTAWSQQGGLGWEQLLAAALDEGQPAPPAGGETSAPDTNGHVTADGSGPDPADTSASAAGPATNGTLRGDQPPSPG